MYNQNLGKKGEVIIENYLIEKGYRILDRNYHKRVGEIDLIAGTPNDEVIFIEVKTRTNAHFGRPEEAVDFRKLKKMIKTAHTWLLEKNKSNCYWRIDIIALELLDEIKITHLENVTL